MAGEQVTFRHTLFLRRRGGPAETGRPDKRPPEYVCACGYYGNDWEPSAVRNLQVVAHCKLARQWKYVGAEVHYGERYYLWENRLTGRKFAWMAERYWMETVLGMRNPR